MEAAAVKRPQRDFKRAHFLMKLYQLVNLSYQLVKRRPVPFCKCALRAFNCSNIPRYFCLNMSWKWGVIERMPLFFDLFRILFLKYLQMCSLACSNVTLQKNICFLFDMLFINTLFFYLLLMLIMFVFNQSRKFSLHNGLQCWKTFDYIKKSNLKCKVGF